MASDPYSNVVVDLDALRGNFLAVRRLVAPAVRLMAVVKADAYGHGLVAAAGAFARAGADCFGVAEVEEGVRLRQAGIAGEIVVLLGLPPQGIAEAVARELSPVVFQRALLDQLSRQAVIQGKVVGVHLKLDLGMGRLGVEPAAAGELAAAIASLPGLRLAGVLAHFPLADDPGATELCREQWERFQRVAAALQNNGQAGERPLLHMANSAALFRFPETHADMVRPGISLYGYPPADPAPVAVGQELNLRPAMSLCSRVLQVKELPAGRGISYGHRFITTRPTRLAVLPLGYAHGYPRALSDRAEVLIAGRRVPLRGTICMNACMADITELPEVAVGDEVVFLGGQGEEFIGADELAARHDTISYEVLCRFGAANRHRFVGDEAV
ncbi:alanine racemase [Desulfurivibrio sp. D14AmB]|uniref:alanine racemase n=1 Tax=Desulfurivibrio sp. D14AmB TaxID=3374370 RepID=UPI00376EA98C